MFDLSAASSAVSFPESTLPIISGCVAFGTTLALSTLCQKVIGVSTSNKLVASAFGCASVCAASLAAHRGALCGHAYQQDPLFFKNPTKRHQILVPSPHQPTWTVGPLQLPMEDLRICAVGLISFKILGGRFWGIAPSSITDLGSFTRWSIPCGEKYATAKERTMIHKMGFRWGCHTCGSRMLVEKTEAKVSKTLGFEVRRLFGMGPRKINHFFVGDHMPPKSVATQMNKMWLRRVGLLPKVRFRFYPQCVKCSNNQGEILGEAGRGLATLPSFVKASKLKAAGGGRMAHFHGFRFRINHLTGGVLAGATVYETPPKELMKGNPKRFRKWHERGQSAWKDIRKSIGA